MGNANDGDIDIGDNENDEEEDSTSSEDIVSSSASMSPQSSFSSDDNFDSQQQRKGKVVIPLLPLHQIQNCNVQTNVKCESSNIRMRDCHKDTQQETIEKEKTDEHGDCDGDEQMDEHEMNGDGER